MQKTSFSTDNKTSDIVKIRQTSLAKLADLNTASNNNITNLSQQLQHPDDSPSKETTKEEENTIEKTREHVVGHEENELKRKIDHEEVCTPLETKDEQLILPRSPTNDATSDVPMRQFVENFTQYMEYVQTAGKPGFLFVLKSCRDIYKSFYKPHAGIIEARVLKKNARLKAKETFPDITLQHIMELAATSEEVYQLILEVAGRIQQQTLPTEIGRKLTQYSFMFLRSESKRNRIANLRDLLEGKKSIRELNREHTLVRWHVTKCLNVNFNVQRHTTAHPIVRKKQKFDTATNTPAVSESSSQTITECTSCHELREEVDILKARLSHVENKIDELLTILHALHQTEAVSRL